MLPGLAGRGPSVDILVRARREAYRKSFEDLVKEVGEAVEALWAEIS